MDLVCVWGLCVYPHLWDLQHWLQNGNIQMLLVTVLFLFPFTIFFLLHRQLRYRDHTNQKISKSHHQGMSIIPFKWCMKTKMWGEEGSGGLVAHYSNIWGKVVLKCHTCIWQLLLGMNENVKWMLCSTAIFCLSCQLFLKRAWHIQLLCGYRRLPCLNAHEMISPT